MTTIHCLLTMTSSKGRAALTEWMWRSEIPALPRAFAPLGSEEFWSVVLVEVAGISWSEKTGML